MSAVLCCPHCHREIPIAHAPLTKKQARMFRFIERFIREHAAAPSLAEIAEEFNLGAIATVHEHLRNLERKGVLRRGTGPRNIVLLLRSDEIGEAPSTASDDEELGT